MNLYETIWEWMSQFTHEDLIWEENGRWSITSSHRESGVNLQAPSLKDDTEYGLPQDIIISPSFPLLSCRSAPSTQHRTVWPDLQSSPWGRFAPITTSCLYLGVNSISIWKLQFETAQNLSFQKKGYKTLTCSAAPLKRVPLRWLKPTWGKKQQWYL